MGIIQINEQVTGDYTITVKHFIIIIIIIIKCYELYTCMRVYVEIFQSLKR